MASQVDICNLALGKLAQDKTISSLSEQSKEARLFGRVWDLKRDEVLADAMWPFALTSVALAQANDAPLLGWTYRYARPADCLTLVAVTDENGMRLGRRLGDWCDPMGSLRQRYAYEYEVTHGEQSSCICTDIEAAYAVYITRIEDTGRYPPKFVEALACKLAEEIAPALIGDAGLNKKGDLKQLYLIALGNASAHDFNEAATSPSVTPAIAARYV